MSSRNFILIMAVLAFVQGTLLPPVFLEGLAIFLFLVEGAASLPAVFLAGLVFDVVQAQPLGLGSLLFLGAAAAVNFLSGKLPLKTPLGAGIFVVAFNIVRSQATIGEVSVISLLMAFLITLVIARPGYELRGKIKV